MLENISNDKIHKKGLKKKFINLKSNKFFRFLNKKRIIVDVKEVEEDNNNNNNNNNNNTNNLNDKTKNDDGTKSLISVENCIKVKEFLKKLDQNSKNFKKDDEKIKNINQKTNSYDVYRYNMNNCIKLLETSIDNRSNKSNVKCQNTDYLSSNEIPIEIPQKKKDEKIFLNISNDYQLKPNNDDDSSESDLASLISAFDHSINSNKLQNRQTVNFSNQNPNPSKSSNSSYSCLNAGSKLIEIVQNLIKKT
jgi:hypothetical protein